MSLFRRAINTIFENRSKAHFLKHAENSFNLSSEKLKRAYKLGFTPDEYVIYDLDLNNPNDYMSEYERVHFRKAITDKRILLDNKIVFYYLVKDNIPVNRLLCYKINGTFHSEDDAFNYNNFLNSLKQLKKLVYKKVNLGGGEGFRLLEFENNIFKINRFDCQPEDIKKLLNEDDYLVEEYCYQSKYQDELYPYSVNTIRVITIKEKDKVTPVIAFQRMGSDKNSCVDNACMGGLYSLIDIETGVLSAGRSHGKDRLIDEHGKFIEYEKHPVTQVPIKGRAIPNWDRILEEIREYHRFLSFTGIEFIAWDIALTENGLRIIEANPSCSMDLLQTFSGQRNQTIGKWMKKKGYIK